MDPSLPRRQSGHIWKLLVPTSRLLVQGDDNSTSTHTVYNGGSWQPASHFSERDACRRAWVGALTSSRGGRRRTQLSPVRSGMPRCTAKPPTFFFLRPLRSVTASTIRAIRPLLPDATPVAVAVGALRYAAVNASIGWPVAKPGLLRARYFCCYHYRFVPFLHACGLVEAGTAVRSSHRDGELLACILLLHDNG